MRTVRRSRGRPPLCRIITNIHILIEWRKSVMKLIVINIHSQNWGSMVKSISLDKLGTQKIKLNWWSKMISLNETHSYRAYETVHYKIITFSQSDMFIMHKHDHLKQQCTSAQWKDFFFLEKNEHGEKILSDSKDTVMVLDCVHITAFFAPRKGFSHQFEPRGSSWCKNTGIVPRWCITQFKNLNKSWWPIFLTYWQAKRIKIKTCLTAKNSDKRIITSWGMH